MRVSTVSIVTPCFNAERLVGRTAESLMGQTAVRSGRVRLQYLVCDGASTDGTLEVVRAVCGGRAEIVSEKDAGMYEALSKGLRRAEGDVVSYLNAGDLYSPSALDVVADVFEQNEVEWITGFDVRYNPRGQVIEVQLPVRYRRRLIRKGMYGTPLLPFHIQQESTFWSRRLLNLVDYGELARFKLAGDHYLWKCFAGEAELRVVASYLGGFAYQAGQKSEDLAGYRRELETLAGRRSLLDVALAAAERVLWQAPVLRGWAGRRTLRYSLTDGRWK